jgi:hypothetical protein
MRTIVIELLKRYSWAPIGVIVAHSILGEVFNHEPYVDPAMHFLGGAAIAYFLRNAAVLSPQYIGKPTAFGLDLGAFGMACFAAVTWEFIEWCAGIFLKTNIYNTADSPLRDLAIGLTGAIIYLLLRRVMRLKSRSS